MNLFPRKLLPLVLPSASKILHSEAKVSFGYPRYISIGAVLLARLVAFRGDPEPLFNHHGLGVVALGLLLEFVEDLVVGSEVLPMHPWKTLVAECYKENPPLHP